METLVRMPRRRPAKLKYATERNYVKLGEYLKEKRLAKRLSQLEVANMLNYSSSQFISNFECGLYAPPLKKLKALLHIYDLSAETVMNLLLEEEKRVLSAVLKQKNTRRSS